MAIWDANRAELATALAAVGFRPLDDDHLLTCAVEVAKTLAAEREEAVSPRMHEELQRERDDMEKERDAADGRAEDLSCDLERAERETKHLRDEVEDLRRQVVDLHAALDGDGEALVERAQAAEYRVVAERERVRVLLVRLQSRLRGLQTEAEKQRANKDYLRHNARSIADEIERELDAQAERVAG